MLPIQQIGLEITILETIKKKIRAIVFVPLTGTREPITDTILTKVSGYMYPTALVRSALPTETNRLEFF
jgi:hypothetical protein